jgi:glycosyl transferase family 4
VTARRAVIVAPYFPPRRRVGSWRSFRFASHLERFGWRPLVICLATPGEAMTERELRQSAGVDRVQLAAPFDRTRTHASGELGSGATSGAGARSRGELARLGARFARAVDAAVPVDTWAPLLAWHAVRLLPLLRRARPAVIFSTADPWSSHLFGLWLARQLGVPWVADFRDPWTLCPFRAGGPAATRAVNRAVERRVIARASRVTFTTERTLARYRDAYPEAALRMSCLPNGFDAALLADPVDAELARLPSDSPLRLCFFGRFRALSPARAVLLALARLFERSPLTRRHIRLHAIGALPPADAALARALGVDQSFEPLPAVEYEHSLATLRRHDLNLSSTAPERDDIVPAKLWDYIAARRPILSLGRNPDVAALLARCSAGVQLDPAATATIAELLERCIESKRAGAPCPVPARPRQQSIAEFEAERLTGRLASMFDALTARPSPERRARRERGR